jgi:hypothetical protein
MSDQKKQEPSYSSLKASLRASNQEAKDYLDSLVELRKRVKEFDRQEIELKFWRSLSATLNQALADLQEACIVRRTHV